MKRIADFLVGGVFFVGIGSGFFFQYQNNLNESKSQGYGNKNEKFSTPFILPDKNKAHELAFPDTTVYKIVDEHLHISPETSTGFVVEKIFSKFGRIPTLFVYYHTKKYDFLARNHQIDSTKAPLKIIEIKEGKGLIYKFWEEEKKYVKIFEWSFLKNNLLKKT